MSEEREAVEQPETIEDPTAGYFDDFDGEPDNEVETAADESDADEEVEVEAGEGGDDAPEADDPPAPSTSDRMDKELQQIQQLRATLQRQVEAAQKNPTPETIAKAEATKDRLDAIIESRDDVDPYKAAVTLAEEGKANKERLAKLEKSLEDGSGASAQQMAAMRQQMARLQFQVDHPDLASRYDELAKAASAEVDKMLGDAVRITPPEVLNRLDGAAFARLIQAEKAKSQADIEPPTEAAPPRKKPVGTNPVKSKSGKSSRGEMSYDDRTEQLLKGLYSGG